MSENNNNESGNMVEQNEEKGGVKSIWDQYKNIIKPILVFGIVYGLIAGGYNFTSMPQWIFVYSNYVVTVVLIAYLTLPRIMTHLTDSTKYRLLATDFMDENNSIFDINMYEIGEDVYNKASYKGGKPYVTPNNFILCEGYDMENNVIQGHWLEKLSNYQLIQYKTALREAKNDMTKEIIEASAKQATAETATIRAQVKLMEYITKQINKKSQMEGSEIVEIIQDTIDENKLQVMAEEAIEEAENGEGVDESEKSLSEVIKENPQAFEGLDDVDPEE